MLADSTSFGFRKFRSVHDACDYTYTILRDEHSAEWILEADIQGCFDNISHEWLIDNIPMDKSVLKQFLKIWLYLQPTSLCISQSTAQGGVISPILANMALDGIEKMLGENFLEVSKRQDIQTKV